MIETHDGFTVTYFKRISPSAYQESTKDEADWAQIELTDGHNTFDVQLRGDRVNQFVQLNNLVLFLVEVLKSGAAAQTEKIRKILGFKR